MAPSEQHPRPRISGARKPKGSRPSSRHHVSSSDGTRSGRRSRQALSMEALAALNEANARSAGSRDAEAARERERRRGTRQVKRQRRAGVDRDEHAPVDTDRPRVQRTRPPSPYDEPRVGSDYQSERREKRRHRHSKVSDSPWKSHQDDVTNQDSRESRRQRDRHHQRSKRRMLFRSAATQEGTSWSRAFLALRGGGPNLSSAYNSLGGKGNAWDDRPRRIRFWTWKKIFIAAGVTLALLIIIVVVAVVVSRKKNGSGTSGPKSSCLKCSLPAEGSIPSDAPDYLNPFKWYDTIDFNVTYTDAMVGELPIMGLNSSWDDSNAPNSLVPALDQDWGSYADRPARGVNLGGWLSIEPWITPDLFNYDKSLGIVDEWTLCRHLGKSCAATLEQHYSSFVTESTFAEMVDAGLDHVRIPFSYWAVQKYDDDPYLWRTSWRYLLRGIEWARKYGLRVNLDLHGIPGSQNGWNHSGRLGPIGWFNGSNSTLNVQRSVDIHDRLSKFFAQDRYHNIISHYGLCNEPKMTVIPAAEVINWTETVYAMVRSNGVKKAVVVFGDGFRGLDKWQGSMTGYGENMVLDVHQYVIFNNDQIMYNHSDKVRWACHGWAEQTAQSMDTSTGFGPTMTAEWSQADTDCATHLTNVGWGNRWTGTYDTGNASDPLRALTPRCPTQDSSCSCTSANADPSTYTDDYKQFLLYFAEAQMDSFEKGWGWFYWTWWTSRASWQWSYKKGIEAGILPKKAYERTFHCGSTTIPDWSPGLPETY